MNLEEMAVKLAEVDQRAKSNTHQIGELKDSIRALNSLAISVERLATEQGHLTAIVKGLRDDVGEIKARPGKWWEAWIKALLAALAGGLVGYLLK